MFDFLGVTVLVFLAALGIWLALRARRAQHRVGKWVGLVLSSLLATSPPWPSVSPWSASTSSTSHPTGRQSRTSRSPVRRTRWREARDWPCIARSVIRLTRAHPWSVRTSRRRPADRHPLRPQPHARRRDQGLVGWRTHPRDPRRRAQDRPPPDHHALGGLSLSERRRRPGHRRLSRVRSLRWNQILQRPS